MSPYLFALLYLFICLLYMVRMRKSPEKGNRVIFKVLPIGMLLGATVSCLADSKVLTIKHPDFLPRIYTLGGGLIFYCMAFIYSEFTTLVIYSSFSYIVALAIYVYGLSNSFTLFKEFNGMDIVILVAIFVVSGAVYLYLLPRLPLWVAILFAVQLILESLFLAVQVILVFKRSIPFLHLGAAGTLAIYLSDLLSAISTWKRSSPNYEVFCMSLNYIAMLMICGSIVLVVL